MSTITAVLEPDADGTVRLPFPAEMRGGKVRVTATVQAVNELPAKYHGTLLDALNEFEKAGGVRDVIPDPVAWQREQRIDLPLPGRD